MFAAQKQGCRKKHHSREEKRKYQKSMQAYKGMWFPGNPMMQDQDVESSTDSDFPKR